MALDVAHVVRVVGRAWVRGEDGNLVSLRSGSRVALGVVIVTDDNSLVELRGHEGGMLVIGHDREVQLQAEVFTLDADPSSSRVLHADVLGDLVDALIAHDASVQQDAVIQVQNNDGNSFVRLFQMLQTSPISAQTDDLNVSRTAQAVASDPQEDSADETRAAALLACLCTEGQDTLPMRLVSQEGQAEQPAEIVLMTGVDGAVMALSDLLTGSDGKDLRSLSGFWEPDSGTSSTVMAVQSGGRISGGPQEFSLQAQSAIALADGAEQQMSWVQAIIAQGKPFDA